MEKTNEVIEQIVDDLPSSDEIIENIAFWFNLLMIKGISLINQRNAMSKPLDCIKSEV